MGEVAAHRKGDKRLVMLLRPVSEADPASEVMSEALEQQLVTPGNRDAEDELLPRRAVRKRTGLGAGCEAAFPSDEASQHPGVRYVERQCGASGN